MLSGIGPGSILLILVIVLLLFGTKKLRNIGSDLGGAIKGFRKAVQKDDEDPEQIIDANSKSEQDNSQ